MFAEWQAAVAPSCGSASSRMGAGDQGKGEGGRQQRKWETAKQVGRVDLDESLNHRVRSSGHTQGERGSERERPSTSARARTRAKGGVGKREEEEGEEEEEENLFKAHYE